MGGVLKLTIICRGATHLFYYARTRRHLLLPDSVDATKRSVIVESSPGPWLFYAFFGAIAFFGPHACWP